jgi:hypothetical protein
MIAALVFFAASYAAFCIWLAVRFINRRERWVKRSLIAVGFLTILLYPWTWGPAIFVVERLGTPPWAVTAMEVYRPLIPIVTRWGRARILRPYIIYSDWWIGGSSFGSPVNPPAPAPDAKSAAN